MLFDRANWAPHRPWLALIVLATGGSIAWFWSASRESAQWPGGSSLPGFTFGVVGGLIIIFEILLWVRKRFRVWRVGRAQTWLRAHIWLGLLCLPLLILHSGLRLGGTLSTVLMVLLVMVIASGVWGLFMQNLLPQRMLEEVPAETIYSQIGYLTRQLLREADRLVSATCGVESNEAGTPADSESRQDADGHMIVGAIRSAGGVKGKVLNTWVPTAPIPETEKLADFYHDQVAPFLQQGGRGKSLLVSAGRSESLFRAMKTKLPPAAHQSLAALEDFCQQRRQWDMQARLYFWLHNWLWVHLPLSVALVVLMAVHILVALKYW